MQAQLSRTRLRSNVIYGFLNGENEALNFVKTANYPKENIREILLFTDGMLIPNEDRVSRKILTKLLNYLSRVDSKMLKAMSGIWENSDPNCNKYLRFKQHDDLTL